MNIKKMLDIFLSQDDIKRALFLFGSAEEKNKIIQSFFENAPEDEQLAYVTNDADMKEPGPFPYPVLVTNLEGLRTFEGNKKRMRIIVEYSPRTKKTNLLGKRQRPVHPRIKRGLSAGGKNGKNGSNGIAQKDYLAKFSEKHRLLFISDVNKISDDSIKALSGYNKVVFFTNGKELPENENAVKQVRPNGLFAESFVKNHLELLILALLLNKPLCGKDIVECIHKNFNLIISPGTLYPLLHDLEGKKLLSSQLGIKTKTYSIAKEQEKEVESTIHQRIDGGMFFLDAVTSFARVRGASE